MPLTFQPVQVPIGGSIDEKQDPALLPMGQLAEMQNAWHTKLGSVNKRFGYYPYTSGTLNASPGGTGSIGVAPPFQQLAPYNGQQLLGISQQGTDIYSLSPSSNLWSRQDRTPPVAVKRQGIVNNGGGLFNVDLCYCNGFYVIAWSQLDPTLSFPGAGIYYTVLDAATFAVVVPQKLLQTNAAYYQIDNCIRVLTNVPDPKSGERQNSQPPIVAIVWTASNAAGSGNYNLSMTSLNMAGPVPTVRTPTVTHVISSPDIEFAFDACSGPSAVDLNLFDVFYTVHLNADSNITMFAWFFQDLTNFSNYVNVSVTTPVVQVGCAALDGILGVCYGAYSGGGPSGFSNYLQTFDSSDFLSKSGEQDVGFGGSGGWSALSVIKNPSQNAIQQVWTLVSQNSGDPQFGITSVSAQSFYVGDGGVTLIGNGPQMTTFNLQMISRPFSMIFPSDINGTYVRNTASPRTYFFGYMSSSLQGTQFLVDCSTSIFNPTDPVHPQMVPVAVVAPRLSQYAGFNNNNQLTSVVIDPATAFPYQSQTPLVFNTLCSIAQDIGQQPRSGIEMLTMDFSPLTSFQDSELGGDLHFTSGVPFYYDGANTGEIGFLMFPDPVTYLPSSHGGGMAGGDYQYAVCYEWIDNYGNKHQSAPSIQSNVVVPTTPSGSVTLVIPTCTLTWRQQISSGSTHPINIAIYRSTEGGTVLYRLTPDSPTGATSNNMLTSEITYVDEQGDGSAAYGLASHTPLYTEGGVLANFNPPSAKYCCSTDQRLWLAGCDDPKLVYYSQQVVSTEAIAFSDELSFSVDDGGDITGICPMDDSLIIFKSDRIFTLDVVGQGPTPAGSQNQLQAPSRIPTDGVGCIDARSIVLTPDGIMFQSSIGIYLLTRQGEVQNVGNPVIDTLTQFSDITSAVIHPTQSQVRFTIGNLSLAAPYSGSAFQSQGVTLVNDYINKSWSVDVVYDSVFGVTSSMQSAACVFNDQYVMAGASTSTHLPASGSAYYETAGWFDGPQMTSQEFIPTVVTSPWISVGDLNGCQSVTHVSALLSMFDGCNVTVGVGTDYNPSFTQVGAWTPAEVKGSLVNTVQSILQLHVRDQRSTAFRVQVSDSYASGSTVTGQGIALQRLTLRAGIKPGNARVKPSGRQ